MIVVTHLGQEFLGRESIRQAIGHVSRGDVALALGQITVSIVIAWTNGLIGHSRRVGNGFPMALEHFQRCLAQFCNAIHEYLRNGFAQRGKVFETGSVFGKAFLGSDHDGFQRIQIQLRQVV